MVFDTDGSTLWSRTTQDATSGITGSSVFDFEGDGVAEVVYADEVTLWIFNGPDGQVKLQYTEHTSNTWLEYPVISDVDGDGAAEIVWGHNPYQDQALAYYGISVIADAKDSWQPTRQIWNQHAYSIVNVDDDATIPATPAVNWQSYNNFRSADLAAAGEPGDAPDLQPAIVCSWRHEGSPLDMRMDTRQPTTAADLVNGLAPDALASGFEAVLSGGGAQCDELNDRAPWQTPVCP